MACTRHSAALQAANRQRDDSHYGTRIEQLESRVLLAVGPVGPQFAINSTIVNTQADPAIATDPAGHVVIAWTSVGQDGDGDGVFARRFDSQGQPLGEEFQVNTRSAGSQRDASVAVDAFGNFAIAWESASQDGSGYGIYLQRYTREGAPLDGELQLNVTTAGDQVDPVIAADSGGNLVVAWTNTLVRSSADDIAARVFTAGGSWGPEVRLNSTLTGRRGQPSAAMQPNGEFIAAWQGDDGLGSSQTKVYARRFAAGGSALGDEFRVFANLLGQGAGTAVTVGPSGQFAVGGRGGSALMAQRFTSGGVPMLSPVDFSSAFAYPFVLRMDAQANLLAMWTDISLDGSAGGIAARRISAANEVQTEILLINAVTTGDQSAPAMAMTPDGNFAATWQSPDGGGTGIFAQRFEAFANPAVLGSAVWVDSTGNGIQDITESSQISPTVRLYAAGTGQIVSVGTINANMCRFENLRPDQPYFLEFLPTGGRILTLQDQGADNALDSDADPATGRTPVFSLPADGIDLSWDAGYANPGRVEGTLYRDSDGNRVRGLWEAGLPGRVVYMDYNSNAVRDAGEPSAVTGLSGGFLIDGVRGGTFHLRVDAWPGWSSAWVPAVNSLLWQTVTVDVPLQNSASDIPLEPMGPESPIEPTLPSGDTVITAMDAAGNYVVAWSSFGEDGDGMSVLARRYDAAGASLGDAFRVNQTTAGSQALPALAVSSSGAFVLAWESPDASGTGIFARLYRSDGAPVGDEVAVNQTTAGTQRWARVAMMLDGGFIVIWHTDSPNASGDIYARRFDAAGQPTAGEFKVNTTTGISTFSPVIAVGADGRFTVLWIRSDSNSVGVYAQRFDTDSQRLGTEFRVNTVTLSDQVAPAMAYAPDGSSLVAWETGSRQSQAQRIAAQFYDNTGAPLGSEFTLATVQPSSAPSVAADGDGGYLVTWESREAVGDTTDVLAQRFNAAGVPVGRQFRVNSTTANNQISSSAAMSAGGDAVVTWFTRDRITLERQRFLQRFAAIAGAVTLGGRVWNDLDGNSVRDPSDTPATGATVQLLNETGQLIDTVVTDSTGLYRFAGLRPGAGYYLAFSGPYFAQPDVGDEGADSDVNRVTARSQLLVLAPAEQNLQVDAGLWTAARIAGLAFNDLDSDGLSDPGEVLLSGWRAFLDANGDGIENPGETATTTDADGSYSFDGLSPYVNQTLKIVVPRLDWSTAGSTVTTPVAPGVTTTVNFALTNTAESTLMMAADAPFDMGSVVGGALAQSAVAADAQGNFVVAWSHTPSGQHARILAQRFDRNGARVGSEFLVASDASVDCQNPAVAMDADGDFVVAWQAVGVHLARFGRTGQFLGAVALDASANALNPTVAMSDGGAFVVAWESPFQAPFYGSMIRARLFNSLGSGGPAFRVGSTLFDETSPYHREASAAMDADGDFVIAWNNASAYGNSLDGGDIFAQRFDPSGSALGSDFCVSVNDGVDVSQSRPSVAMSPNGTFLVSWLGRPYQLSDEATVSVRFYDWLTPFQSRGEPFKVNAATLAGPPRVAADDAGNFSVAFGCAIQRYNRAGMPQGGNFTQLVPGGSLAAATGSLIATGGGTTQRYDVFPASLGASVGGVVWRDDDSDGIRDPGEPGFEGLALSFLNGTGATLATEITGTGGAYLFAGVRGGMNCSISVARPANSIHTLFSPQDRGLDDLLDSDANADGQIATFAIPVGTNDLSRSAGLMAAATIAGQVYEDLNGDNQVQPAEALTGWTVYIDDDYDAQLDPGERSDVSGDGGCYSLTGLPLGTYNVRVLVPPFWIDPGQRDVVITDTAAPSVVPLKVTPAPVAPMQLRRLGGEVPVSALAVGAAADGSFVVAWVGHTADDAVTRARAQVFARDGTALTGVLVASSTVTWVPNYPQVAVNANGDFVVLWVDCNSSGSVPVLSGRLFDRTGVPKRDQFSIGSAPVDNSATATFVTDGSFVIMWRRTQVDLRARRFSAAGLPLSAEIVLVADPGAYPGELAALPNGDFVATWETSGSIFARRFDALGTPVGPAIRVDNDNPNDSHCPRIGADSAGNFVIAYNTRLNGLTSTQAVMARRFNAAGNPLGSEFQVGTIQSTEVAPRGVAFDDTGGFVIGWTQPTPVGTADSLARRYLPSGKPAGPQFRASLFTAANLHDGPARAANGDLVMLHEGRVSRVQFISTFTSIAGLAWADANNNGLRDGAEGPAAGVTARLLDASGALLASTALDGNGFYEFASLDPQATYFVEFQLPSDRGFARTDQGADDTADSDASFVTGRSGPIIPAQTPNAMMIDAGTVTAPRISGAVYIDADNDRIVDAGETRIAGWTIFIDADGNQLQDPGERFTQTDASGNYLFDPAPAGSVSVVVRARQGWQHISSAAVSLTINPADSRVANFAVWPTGAPLYLGQVGSTVPVAADASINQTGPAAALDASGNFLIGWNSDAGGGDVLVQRFDVAGPLAPALSVGATPLAQRQIDLVNRADGEFAVAWVSEFPGGTGVLLQRWGPDATPRGPQLRADEGSFTGHARPQVALDSTGAGVLAWTALEGAQSDVFYRRFDLMGQFTGPAQRLGVNSTWVSLGMNPSGAMVIAYNGGMRRFDPAGAPAGDTALPGISQPVVSLESDGDSVIGWTDRATVMAQRFSPAGIELTDPFALFSGADSDAPGLVARDDGTFAAAFLAGGVARVQLFNASGLAQGIPLQAGAALSGGGVDLTLFGSMLVLAWTSGSTQDGDVQAARFVFADQPAVVAGRVWNDADADGIQDAGETGRDGVGVTLLSAQGQSLATVTTAGGGLYRFDAFAPGAYRVSFDAPAPLLRSALDAGNNDAADSDADPASGLTALFLTASTGQLTLDAGVYRRGLLAGVCFHDANANGLRDNAEVGMGGWTIFLDQDNNGQLDAGEPSTLTDAGGSYSFIDLTPAVYRVAVLTQPGAIATTPIARSVDLLTSLNLTAIDFGSVGSVPDRVLVPVGPEQTLNPSTSALQSSAMDALGNFVTVSGPQLRRYDAAGTLTGNLQLADQASDSAVEMLPDGRIVAAWVRNGTWVRLFGADLQPASEPIAVNSSSALNLDIDADADGNFVVAWGSSQGTAAIGARRFNATGVPQGDAITVQSLGNNRLKLADVALQPQGTFIAVWNELRQDDKPLGVSARRFNPDGTTAGPIFGTSASDTDPEQSGSVGVDATGSFVLVWGAGVGTGLVNTVKAQRYDAAGTPLGGPLVVNTTAARDPAPRIAMDLAGSFTIAWDYVDLYSTSTRVGDVYAQRFSSSGARVGGEVSVNTTRTQVQYRPQILTQATGVVRVIWRHQVSSPYVDSTFSQRYQLVAPPVAAIIPDITIGEDSGPVSLNVHEIFSDLDSPDSALSFALTPAGTLVSGTTFNPATGILTASLVANAAGSATMTLTATDPQGARGIGTFTLTLAAANDPPSLTPIANQVIEAGAPARVLQLTGISAGPGESETAQVSVTTDKPQLFASLQATYTGGATGTLTFAPAAGVAGSAIVTVTISDAGQPPLSLTRTFTVQVTPDITLPTATIPSVTPNPRLDPVPSIAITFSEAVVSFNLSLTRNSGANLLTSEQTPVTSDDGKTWTIPNLAALSFIGGTYRIQVSGARDLAGLVNPAVVSQTWTQTLTRVAGTPGNDNWNVRLTGDYLEIVGGPMPLFAPLREAGVVRFDALDGTDTLTLTGYLAAALDFVGGGGDDTLRVIGTPAADLLTIGQANIAQGASVVSFSQIEAMQIDTGPGDDRIVSRLDPAFVSSPSHGFTSPPPAATPTRAYIGGAGSDTLVLADGAHLITDDLSSSIEHLHVANAVVSLGVSQRFAGVRLESAARVLLAPNGTRALYAASLNLAADAFLDLADNALVIDAAPADRQALLQALTQLVRSARQPVGAPAWSGKGITSQTAATRTGTGLSIVSNDAGSGALLRNQLNGFALDANSIIVRYGYQADANLDGRVDIDDYFRIDRGYSLKDVIATPLFADGDFDLDGQITADDYFIIDSNFVGQSGPLAASPPPEPTPVPPFAALAAAHDDWLREVLK